MENVVYTTRTCPFCIEVKRLLEGQGVEFEERLLDSREQMTRIKDEYNWRTVPLVILNGQFIGGFNETNALVRAGKLDETLGRG